MKRYLSIITFLLCFATVTLAQEETRLGFNLTTNFDTYKTIKPEFGLVFEKRATEHSGIELGLNYRTYYREMLLLINNTAYYPFVSERYITVPVTYKYYSKIINVSGGLSFDYFAGWRQTGGEIDLTSYRPGERYYAGLLAKVSREISVGSNFLLEPELKFNALLIPYSRFYGGVGIVGKFRLGRE